MASEEKGPDLQTALVFALDKEVADLRSKVDKLLEAVKTAKHFIWVTCEDLEEDAAVAVMAQLEEVLK